MGLFADLQGAPAPSPTPSPSPIITPPPAPRPGIFADLIEPAQRFDEQAQTANLYRMQGGTPLERTVASIPAMVRQPVVGLAQAGSDVLGLAGRVGFMSEEADQEQRWGNELDQAAAAIDQKGGSMSPGFNQALRGATRSLATMAATPGGPVPKIIGAAIVRANQALTEGKDAGLTPGEIATYATRAGIIEGGVAGLFQKFGAGGLESVMGGKVAVQAGIKAGLRSLGKSYLEELPEEVTTEVLDQVNQQLSRIDPNAASPEQLAETVKQTVAQTVLSVGMAHGGHHAAHAIATPGPLARLRAVDAAGNPQGPDGLSEQERGNRAMVGRLAQAERQGAAEDRAAAQPPADEERGFRLLPSAEELATMRANRALVARNAVLDPETRLTRPAPALPAPPVRTALPGPRGVIDPWALFHSQPDTAEAEAARWGGEPGGQAIHPGVVDRLPGERAGDPGLAAVRALRERSALPVEARPIVGVPNLPSPQDTWDAQVLDREMGWPQEVSRAQAASVPEVAGPRGPGPAPETAGGGTEQQRPAASAPAAPVATPTIAEQIAATQTLLAAEQNAKRRGLLKRKLTSLQKQAVPEPAVAAPPARIDTAPRAPEQPAPAVTAPSEGERHGQERPQGQGQTTPLLTQQPAPATVESTAPARNQGEIQDFGEKLGGARKDRLTLADLDRMSPEERQTAVTKQTVWPEIDHAAAIASGQPATVAHVVHQVRGTIAAKPVMTSAEAADPVKREAAIREYLTSVSTLRDRLTAARTLKDVTAAYRSVFPGFFEGMGPAGIKSPTATEDRKTAQARYLRVATSNALNSTAQATYKAQRRAEEAVGKGWPAAPAWTSRYEVRQSSTRGADGQTRERWYVRARNEDQRRRDREAKAPDWHDDRAAAEAEAARRYESMGRAQAGGMPVRPLKADLKRVGTDHRQGRDVGPADFSQAFGFRGVEFGNWTNQADRQQGLNQAFDALHDLAEVLGVPPRALSLDGRLGVAFGARGGGRFAAHYEPGKVVINLTRTRGAGALAHEWAHGVDNYFGKLGLAGKVDAWASSERDVQAAARDIAGATGLRPEIAAAWLAVRQAITGPKEQRTQYLTSAHGLDGKREKPYWSEPTELFARAFETWVAQRLEDGGKASPYLVQGVPTTNTPPAKEGSPESDWMKAYPTGAEAQRINAAIGSLAAALKTEERGGRTRLFSPERTPGEEPAPAGPVMVKPDALGTSANLDVLHARARGWIKANLAGKTLTAPNGLVVNRFSADHLSSKAKTSDELRALTVIPEILAAARWNATMPDKHGRGNIRAVHQFEAPVVIDKREYLAGITVMEAKDGGIYYEQRLLSKDRSRPASAPPGPDLTGDHGGIVDARPAENDSSLPPSAEDATRDEGKTAPIVEPPTGAAGRMFTPERTPGEALGGQDRTPGEPGPRPAASMGIEPLVEWAQRDRARTIALMQKRLDQKPDSDLADEYRRTLDEYQAVDPEEMAAHMRAFPGHYLRAAGGQGGNMSPVQVFRQRTSLPPVEARVAPAPVAPADGKAPDLRATIKTLADGLRQASPDAPLLDVDRGATKEAGGFYDPSNQAVVVKYHNDLDLVAHEVGHWAAEAHDLLPAAGDVEARAELARFGVHGTPEKGERALREGMAEWFRAWMVNPAEAERRAPVFSGQVQQKMPAPVMAALRAYGDSVRTFMGANAREKVAAGVLGFQAEAKEAKAQASLPRKVVNALLEVLGRGPREKPARDGAVPKGWNKATGWEGVKRGFLFQMHDTDAPMAANYALSLAMIGVDPASLSPSKSWDVLRTVARGENGRVRDMVLHTGLADANGTVATDRGQRMNLEWLLEPLRSQGEGWSEIMDRAHAYGVAQRSLEIEKRLTDRVEEGISRYTEQRMAEHRGIPPPAVEQEIAAHVAKERAALRRQLARLTASGGGMENSAAVAREALAELENDPHKDQIKEYLRRYRAWANWNLQYAVDGELLSPAQAAQIQDANEFYIDWHRVFGDDDDPITIGEAVEGSMRSIHNPLASLLHATWSTVHRADRNRLMLTFTAPLRQAGEKGKGALASLGMQISQEAGEKAFRDQQGYHDAPDGTRRKVYRIQRIQEAMNDQGEPQTGPNGEALERALPEFWTFDPGTEASLEAARKLGSDHPYMQLLQGLNGLQRSMITLAPNFRLKVPVRDNIERLLSSEVGSGMSDVPAILKGKADLEGRSVDELFSLSGAGMAGWNQHTREQAVAEITAYVEDQRKQGWKVLTPGGAWRAWQRFGEAMENVARKAEFMAAFRDARKQGMGEWDSALFAATKARGLLDTAQKGYLIGRLNGISLFLNAAMKGLARNTLMARQAVAAYRRGDAETGNRLARTVTARLVVAGALSAMVRMAYLAAFGDDEDKALEAMAEPQWKRDFAWRFDLPLIGKVAIPKPYEAGWLMSGFDRAADAAWAAHRAAAARAAGKADLALRWAEASRLAYDGYGKSFVGAVVPSEADMLTGSLTPAVEVMTNHSLFQDRDIVPRYEKQKDLDLRKGQEHASVPGRIIGAVVRSDARAVDHLIRGYLGGFGNMATSRTWAEFARRATGYSGDTPLMASRDVSFVLERAEARGLGQRKPYQNLRNLLKVAGDQARPAAERDQAKDSALRLASRLRTGLESGAAGGAP